MPGLTIVGTGRYVPGDPVTNEMLSRVMDTSDDWIRQRTGIGQRHFAPEGVGASDLAVVASQRAIAAAGLQPADIDYIIFATMTPDFPFPGPGGLLGAKLGIPGVPALDIRQQCCAMPYAFQVADGLVATGAASSRSTSRPAASRGARTSRPRWSRTSCTSRAWRAAICSRTR